MDTKSVGNLLGSILISGTGTVGSVSSALAEGLRLANHLLEPDPSKRAKVRRDYYMSLLKIVKEVQNADQKDVSDLVVEFTNLLNK